MWAFDGRCADCKYCIDGECTNEHAVYCQHCELWTLKQIDGKRKENEESEKDYKRRGGESVS